MIANTFSLFQPDVKRALFRFHRKVGETTTAAGFKNRHYVLKEAGS